MSVRTWSAALLAASVCLLPGCTITFEENNGPLTIHWINGSRDTVSVMPRIVGVFSGPVIDSTVAFEFYPSFPSSYVVVGSRHDTFTIVTAAMLEGRSRYVIRPAGMIRAANGSSIGPGEDSLVIHTHDREAEPNATPGTADTLRSVMCATLSTASDTDCFLCLDPGAGKVWVRAFESPVFITLLDSLLQPAATGRRDVPADTLTVPSPLRPFYIVVTPSQAATAGYYELGVVSP